MMARDRRDVAHEIEVELFIERRVDRVARSDLQKCVAVSRRPQGRLSPDIAGSTRPVVDYEFLAETLRQPLRHHARNNVGRPASGKANNDSHRTRGIDFFRPCDARDHRQRGSTRCQLQESSARMFHGVPSAIKAFRVVPSLHIVSAAWRWRAAIMVSRRLSKICRKRSWGISAPNALCSSSQMTPAFSSLSIPRWRLSSLLLLPSRPRGVPPHSSAWSNGG